MNLLPESGKENELITTLEHFLRKCYPYPQQVRTMCSDHTFNLTRKIPQFYDHWLER